jgi:hypothetical protein
MSPVRDRAEGMDAYPSVPRIRQYTRGERQNHVARSLDGLLAAAMGDP